MPNAATSGGFRKPKSKGGCFMPQPNDKCPCGSGKAYKDCCGKAK